MKIILSSFLMFFCVSIGYSQKDYPEPVKTASRLFYIQHSNNQNTYVYDANMDNGVINAHKPIDEYRIIYTQKGVKKPLSSIQRKLAYGMILLDSQPNLFKLRLTATEKIEFLLNYDVSEGARVNVTVNDHKIYLDKMFVQLIGGHSGASVKVEYVLFYGKDYNSGELVTEKVMIEK